MQNFMTEFQIKKRSKSVCSFIKIARHAAMFICGKKTTRKNHARKSHALKCRRGNVSAEMSCAEVSVNRKLEHRKLSTKKRKRT